MREQRAMGRLTGHPNIVGVLQVGETESGYPYLVMPYYGLPHLPGVAMVSEILTALEAGYTELKFFPTEAAGGANYLKSVSSPIPAARFCPTGGISTTNAAQYHVAECRLRRRLLDHAVRCRRSAGLGSRHRTGRSRHALTPAPTPMTHEISRLVAIARGRVELTQCGFMASAPVRWRRR